MTKRPSQKARQAEPKLVTARNIDNKGCFQNTLPSIVQNDSLYTPHIGNKWREDLYLASFGIKSAQFLRNFSVLDSIDRPELLILNNNHHPIACPQQLTKAVCSPFLKFSSEVNEKVKNIISDLSVSTPAQLHYKASVSALPLAKNTTSAYEIFLQEDSTLLRKVLVACCESFQENPDENKAFDVFSRFLTDKGFILRRGGRDHAQEFVFDGSTNYPNERLIRDLREETRCKMSWFFELCEGLHSLVSSKSNSIDQEGPLPDNHLMVLCLALQPLFKALQYKESVPTKFISKTVCGPSMVKYAKTPSFCRKMTNIYKVVKRVSEDRFSLKMPETIELVLVPGANISYLPVVGESDGIDAVKALSKATLEIKDSQKSIKSMPDKRQVGRLMGELRKKEHQAIARVVETCKNLPHVSQYDLLTGTQLFNWLDVDGFDAISFRTHKAIVDAIDLSKEKTLHS